MTVDEFAAIFHPGERVFTAERWPTLVRNRRAGRAPKVPPTD